MIFFLNLFFERGVAQNQSFHSGGQRLRNLSGSTRVILPERISDAVSESRIYHEVRMEFHRVCVPIGCALKPVDEVARPD